jgi:hypothetical protein
MGFEENTEPTGFLLYLLRLDKKPKPLIFPPHDAIRWGPMIVIRKKRIKIAAPLPETAQDAPGVLPRGTLYPPSPG